MHVESRLPATSVPTAEALVAQYGSPLYVYQAPEIRRRFEELRAAFAYRPLELHYAIVCNKNPFIVRTLYELGAGVHANTPGDAYCALSAGVDAGRIVYSGTNLDQRDLSFLIEHGIHANLDSLDQLRAFGRLTRDRSVGLRLLIDAAASGNRIGVTVDELAPALHIAATSGLRISTLHMYVGTNTRRTSRFSECLERLLQAAAELPDLTTIDVGGGFGVAYNHEAALDLVELGRSLSERMERACQELQRRLTLVLEPGRILVGSAGNLFTTVVSVKERGGRRFVGVDSTVGNLVVPSVYHMRHRVRAVSPRSAPLEIPTDVCGNTTHSRDFLGRDLRLPELRPGDLLCICDVGAYGYAMSSHFLNRPRPAEVWLDVGGAQLTTRRETFEDLIATQVVR